MGVRDFLGRVWPGSLKEEPATGRGAAEESVKRNVML